MSIGEQIKELLYEERISQKQLAEDLKIPPTTLSGYIRDFREPDVETLKIIADYFNVTIDYLLEFNLAPVKQKEKLLNIGEMGMLSIYRKLKAEQQELLVEQGKLYLKMNNKKGQTLSDTTLKTGTENSKK